MNEVEDTVCASFGELSRVVREIGMSVLPDFKEDLRRKRENMGGRGLFRARANLGQIFKVRYLNPWRVVGRCRA